MIARKSNEFRIQTLQIQMNNDESRFMFHVMFAVQYNYT